MKTRTYTTHRPFKPVLFPRPSGGFFIKCAFPEKTRAGLTKVNKLRLNISFTKSYRNRIFPMVKPVQAIVNKIAVLATQNLLLTTHDLRLTTGYYIFFTFAPYLKEKQ